MKCVLHIGTEKTGTTLLQDWLYDNQMQLGEMGIYLSDNLGKSNNRLFPVYFQDHLDDWAMREGISSVAEKEKYFDGFLQRLAEEIGTANKSYDYFVITSEHLHSRVRNKGEIERIHTFLASVFDEVEVICYFRDQFEVAVSLYSTALIVDSSDSIDSFVDQAHPNNYYYNYLEIADNWSEVFGRSNCNFRIYDRESFVDKDIRLDFLNTIVSDVDVSKLSMDRDSSNASLSLFQAAAFRAINSNIPYWRADKLAVNIANGLAKQMILNSESLKLGTITSTKGDIIRDRFTAINSLFFKKYFTEQVKFPMSQGKSNCKISCDAAMKAVEDAIELGMNFESSTTPSLADDQINSLRDVALRIFDREPNSIEDALTLMKIALNQRPNGPLIRAKVEQWSTILESSNNE